MDDARINVLLVGNYEPDRQWSMLRYARILETELPGCGVRVHPIRPRPLMRGAIGGGLGKWLGYIDKLVVFPWVLRAKVREARGRPGRWLLHVCDHSNAPYLRWAGGIPSLVTVHDLLAIRGARGEFDGVNVGWSGRLLQRMIARGLRGARHVICDSDETAHQFERVIGRPGGVFRKVSVPLERGYADLARGDRRGMAEGGERGDPGYILHVGGDVWYKNRGTVVEAYALLARRLPDPPELYLVGAPPGERTESRLRDAGLRGRVKVWSGIGEDALLGLYVGARCLVFPSLEEGFGWPIVEAQACGCPVITSGRMPMLEVGGEGALYVDPRSPEAIVAAMLEVLGRGGGDALSWRERGARNAARFLPERVIRNLVDVYGQVLG